LKFWNVLGGQFIFHDKSEHVLQKEGVW